MGNCFSVSLFGKLHVSREQSVIFKEYLRIFHTTQLNSSPGAETNTHSNPSSTTPGPTFQFSIAGNLGSYLSSFARDGGESSRRAWSGGGAAQNGGGRRATRMRWEGRLGFSFSGTRVPSRLPVLPAAADGHGPTVRGNPWAFAKSEPSTICDETLGLFKLWAQLSPWWNWWLGFSRTATKPQILTVKRVDRGRVRLILSLKKLSGPASSFLYFFCRL